jgi:hypothetical protein
MTGIDELAWMAALAQLGAYDVELKIHAGRNCDSVEFFRNGQYIGGVNFWKRDGYTPHPFVVFSRADSGCTSSLLDAVRRAIFARAPAGEAESAEADRAAEGERAGARTALGSDSPSPRASAPPADRGADRG